MKHGNPQRHAGSGGLEEALHPRIADAVAGVLPEWAEAGEARRQHMLRVAALLEEWASTLGKAPEEIARWRATGVLHDALRDADPDALRRQVRASLPALADFPAPCLHGPAAAERLRAEGVEDEELLLAVTYHPTGHPELTELGRALYAADFLEPGRPFLTEWREERRGRMPMALDEVVREILLRRIEYATDQGASLRPETLAFRTVLQSGH